MNIMRQRPPGLFVWFMVICPLVLLACSGQTSQDNMAVSDPPASHDEDEANTLALPDLTAVPLAGERLKVVATTSIIGDVVAQVGGEAITLTTLMKPGQDPHSYTPAARDLTAVAEADIIFVNGWDLEEALVHDLEEVGRNVPLVPVSANIEPIHFGAADPGQDHGDHGADPHVWFDIHNVEQWVENVEFVLSNLDPINAATYKNNAAAYRAELAALEDYVDSQLARIPAEQRLLVTNHDSLSYFAQAYDFELIGTVIPAASTLAEPSASDLADLIAQMEAHQICTIFTETTVSDNLAQTVTAELDSCDEIQVLPIYSGALGSAADGAGNYISMMRANIDAIVAGME